MYMAPDGSPLEEKESLRDLGVRVSTDLTFSGQITLAVQSGNSMADWTCRARGRHLMLTVLRTLIQPRPDYCSQLWSPRDQYYINLLEAVQKHFLSQVNGPALQEMTYWERLNAMRVYSQEHRME